MRPTDSRLCLVTDRHQCSSTALGGDDAVSRLEQAIVLACGAGLRIVQIREKDLATGELLSLTRRMHRAASRARCNVLINDRVDISLAEGLAGVQCAEDGFPVSDAKEILGPSYVVGASCHSLEAVLQADNAGADWIFLGPVYETHSKRSYGPPLGVELFSEICQRTTRPVFAIGGITPDRAAECREAGAQGVAVISSILSSPDPAVVIKDFEKALGGL